MQRLRSPVETCRLTAAGQLPSLEFMGLMTGLGGSGHPARYDLESALAKKPPDGVSHAWNK